MRLCRAATPGVIMDNPALIKEYLMEGFKLAYFIVPDKLKALEITRDALILLKVTCLRQDKRKYYDPIGRPIKLNENDLSEGSEREKHRNKVQLTDEHIFQLLIYNRAAKYQDENIDQESLLTFYLMHA